ncbi:MAG: Hsp70 family protein [Candidatus Schekmanbacteria bacterium]|nr:Hsp70 family protein [Candidatus Schekmanbacteria bacterium]
MAKSIGIDLGTTNSVAAIKILGTEILKNAEGELLTPSCVCSQKAGEPPAKPRLVVGRDALAWRKQDPENTVVAVKRLIGRPFDSPEVQQIIAEARVPYRIERHERGSVHSLAINLHGDQLTPEEISAKILDKIRADAEAQLGDRIELCVITVPAYFNDKQKHATRLAAALAGLKVQRLLPEPTAAAICFGVDELAPEDSRTVMVFDLGGGTFDLSVLMISGGQVLEQGKGGDMWLGGADIDRLVAEHVLRETAAAHELDDLRALIAEQPVARRYRFLGQLAEKAEEAKIALSSRDRVVVDILGALTDRDGEELDVEVEFSRAELDRLVAPIAERTVKLTRDLLQSLCLTPDLIDQVLMVGGSSLVPSIVAAVQGEFGAEKVMVHPRPMLAVAEGAAILSHRLADTYECPGCGTAVKQSETRCQRCDFDLERHVIEKGVFDIVHSAAHDYYIYLQNGERKLLIEKGSPLPCETSAVFETVHAEQQLAHLKFVNVVNDVEEPVGDLWLAFSAGADEDAADDTADEDLAAAEQPRHVEIALRVDSDNILEVSAALREHPEIAITKTLSRGSGDEKLLLELEALIDRANKERYSQYVMTDIERHVVSAVNAIHELLDPNTGQLDEQLFQKTARYLETASRLAAADQTCGPSIFYAEHGLDEFGDLIAPEGHRVVRQRIAELRTAEDEGDYDITAAAIHALHDAIDDHFGVANYILQIQRAVEVYADSDPARSDRLDRSLAEIMDMLLRPGVNENELTELLKKALHEADDALDTDYTATRTIHKDIRER